MLSTNHLSFLLKCVFTLYPLSYIRTIISARNLVARLQSEERLQKALLLFGRGYTTVGCRTATAVGFEYLGQNLHGALPSSDFSRVIVCVVGGVRIGGHHLPRDKVGIPPLFSLFFSFFLVLLFLFFFFFSLRLLHTG